MKIKNPYGIDRENDLLTSDLVEKALDVQMKKKDYFMDFIHLINGEWELVSLDTQTAISKTFDPVDVSTIKNGGIKANVRRI